MALIIAPNSALQSWEREISSEGGQFANMSGWTIEAINVLISDTLINRDAKMLNKPTFILLNKEAVLRDGLIDLNLKWDAVVLDESTFIKNPDAKTTDYFISTISRKNDPATWYLRRFQNVPHRWILAGIPWPEGEQEVYTQMKFVGHDLLGCRNYWQFRHAHMEQLPHRGWDMRGKSRAKVQEDVGSVALIMRRKDVGMGEKVVRETRTVELPKVTRKIYDKAETEFILEIGDQEIETVWEMTKYQWLRQLAGGHVLGKSIHYEKIKELESLRKGELSGERIVVWCDYNSEVESIKKHFGRSAWAITGAVKKYERWKMICAWEKCYGGMLVLQQRCFQMGTDLSASDTAIYFSTPVAYLHRKQTEDRIVSMQKVTTGSPLLLIDIIATNTVDEDIHAAMRKKDRRNEHAMSRTLIAMMRKRRGIYG